MATAPERTPTTIEEFLDLPGDDRREFINGKIVAVDCGAAEHGAAVAGTVAALGVPFQRGRNGPGGWRFLASLDVRFGENLLNPDLCGYRAARLPLPPKGRPISLLPDWVCEVLSPGGSAIDRVEKLWIYFRSRVPNLWVVDPRAGILEVYRLTDIGYAVMLTAQRGQRVRAEPFDAVEIAVDELLGIDPAPEPQT
jgi:Uma2 family endonuclease